MKKYVIKSIKGNTIENLLSRFTYSYSSNTHFYKLETPAEDLGTVYRLFNFGIHTVNVDIYLGDVIARKLDCEANSFIDFTLEGGETLNNIQGSSSFSWTFQEAYLFKHSLVLINKQDEKVSRFFDTTTGVGKPCNNLFNTTTWTNGKLEISGIITGGMYENYMTSDFIPVTGNRTLIAKGYCGDTIYPISIFAYNSTGVMVKQSTNTYCELPESAVKVRFTLNALDKTNISKINIMLEYNQVPSVYEQYYEGYKIRILSNSFNYEITVNDALNTGAIIEYDNHTYKMNGQTINATLSNLGILELHSIDTIKIDSMISPIFDVEVFDDYSGATIESPTELVYSEYLYWDSSIHKYRVSPTGEVVNNIKDIIKLKLPKGGGISG